MALQDHDTLDGHVDLCADKVEHQVGIILETFYGRSKFDALRIHPILCYFVERDPPLLKVDDIRMPSPSVIQDRVESGNRHLRRKLWLDVQVSGRHPSMSILLPPLTRAQMTELLEADLASEVQFREGLRMLPHHSKRVPQHVQVCLLRHLPRTRHKD